MEYFTLNNGVQMPAVGFGAFKLNDEETCVNSVTHAIRSGCRLVDTAAMYRNEAWVGRAVRECGVPREQLFVSTKLWLHQISYEGAKIGFERSLKRLGLDYMDMYMIHWPFGADVLGAWRALEELYEQGLVRSIGVCNFTLPVLKELIKNARVLPAVDQMECHPLCQHPELQPELSRLGIRMEAWGPLARMNPRLMEQPLLGQLAEKYGKTKVQVILRWHLQRGVIAIPKSSTPARIESNLQIFDFSLTPEEMTQMSQLDENFHVSDDPADPTSQLRLGSRPAEF